MGLWASGAATEKFCNIYPHLCLEIVFSAPKMTQNCYLHYDIKIKIGSSLLTPHIVLRDYPPHLTKYEDKGTSKVPIFKPFSELRRIWKCSLVFSKIQIFHFFFMNWEELGSIHSSTYKTNISRSKF